MFFNFAPILHTVPPEHNAGNKAPLWFLWCVNIFFSSFIARWKWKEDFAALCRKNSLITAGTGFCVYWSYAFFTFCRFCDLIRLMGFFLQKLFILMRRCDKKKVFVWIRENLVIVPLIYIPLLGRALLLVWEVLGHSYQAAIIIWQNSLFHDFIKP